jgi:hypothetical protein
LDGKLNVADVGAQQLGNDVLSVPGILRQLADVFGVPYREFGTTSATGIILPSDAPYARELWHWLGCTYLAIDVDGSPDAVPLDLNFDDVPEEHRGRYQLVTNLGTTEHVANQIQAMKVIHDLAAVGGVMLHNVPMQGYTNHGLVNYNPKFFWMLARGNNYEYLGMRVARTEPAPLPANIVDDVARVDPEGAKSLQAYCLPDAGLQVMLRKVTDAHFRAAADMPEEAILGSPKMRQRYWYAT